MKGGKKERRGNERRGERRGKKDRVLKESEGVVFWSLRRTLSVTDYQYQSKAPIAMMAQISGNNPSKWKVATKSPKVVTNFPKTVSNFPYML